MNFATLVRSSRLLRPAVLAAGATVATGATLSSSAGAPKHTLVYFHVRALGECPRMIMEYGGIPYEDCGPGPFFGVAGWMDAKPKTPFGQLPLLYVDGEEKPIAQMGAIARYLASLVPSLVPDDPMEKARCDMIFEASREFDTLNPCVNVWRDAKFEAKKAEAFEFVPTKVANLAKELGDKPFFCGDAVRFCDFAVYHVLSQVRLLEPAVFNAHPNLTRFMSNVEALPRVKEYLSGRPTPVGIGVKPVLEPNTPGLPARLRK